MNRLSVKDIHVSYGNNQIVNGVSFDLPEGNIGCLLGPSGCGKTTILLAIAGFQNPSSGQITINDKVVASQAGFTAPENRNVGMVFQDYALFPNLTVAKNICFGISNWKQHEQRDRLQTLLSLIGMVDHKDNYPHQLSGGQQQRVALARALAPRPSLLLLDEPFSNLDVALRESLAREVRKILKQEGISAILVTHDQHEAFAMADDICVMSEGLIQQQGSATVLYRNPSNAFVANFIGEGSLINAQFVSEQTVETEMGRIAVDNFIGEIGDCVTMLVRPEAVSLKDSSSGQATVAEKVFRGSHSLYVLSLGNGEQLLSLCPNDVHYDIGDKVGFQLNCDHISNLGNT